MGTYFVRVTDAEIILAFNSCRDGIKHIDAPTEFDICEIRDRLEHQNRDIVSLFWLRNRIVALRKAGQLKPTK